MKIGLIAMSGVRSHNKELMDIGLTLPGFVDRSKVIASLPSLSLLTLAAHTPEGFELEYHEVINVDDHKALPRDFDLVAISTFSAQIYEAYAIADQYIKEGVSVVMGGLHVSTLPHEAKEHCSSVVVGEGEILWPKVLNDFKKGELKEYYSQNSNESFDLADSRIPRYDLLDLSQYNRLTVQTSRGCPHRCDFCASSILLTSKYKVKPVKKVIDEIRYIKSLWENPFIEFADDNSFVLRDHYKELLRELQYEDVHWFTEADVSIAEDDELLDLMFKSGCKQVLIGLESPTFTGTDHIEQRRNWKKAKQPDYEKAIKKIQSKGITVNGCFILGLDGDKSDVFENIYDFVNRSGLFEVQITVLTAFPGTPLYRRLKQENRILEDKAWHMCTLFDINYIPKQMTVKELQHGMIELSKKIYNRKFIEERQRRFFKEFRRKKKIMANV